MAAFTDRSDALAWGRARYGEDHFTIRRVALVIVDGRATDKDAA